MVWAYVNLFSDRPSKRRRERGGGGGPQLSGGGAGGLRDAVGGVEGVLLAFGERGVAFGHNAAVAVVPRHPSGDRVRLHLD